MNKISSRLKFIYQYIVSSIGFYPTLISLLFFGFAVLMLYFERLGLSERMVDRLSFMIISNGETARLILSSITTGIISLTVFSFTMVMLVLNQASTNFSPRVIPGLISHKSNQSVMGLYLGTLIYTLVIMVNIRSDAYSASLPGFAIFLAMCFTIICLGFFVYFIHAISQAIQIESILEGIYNMTHERLSKEIEEDQGLEMPNIFLSNNWSKLQSPRTGFLQSIDKSRILEVCKKHDVVIDFEQPLGSFMVEGVPFARVNKHLDNSKELVEKLLDHVNFYREERPDLNYLFGFKHITESAVKALSPGINDPGTAVKSIDYLTALFAHRMQLTDEKVIRDDDGAARIRFAHETFEDLLSTTLSPIRLYGKGSSIIVLRLFYLFQSLYFKVQDYPHLIPVLRKEVMLLIIDANAEISNSGDRAKINERIKMLNQMPTVKEPLPELKEQEQAI